MEMGKKGQREEMLTEKHSWEVFRDYFDVWKEGEEEVKVLLRFLFPVRKSRVMETESVWQRQSLTLDMIFTLLIVVFK